MQPFLSVRKPSPGTIVAQGLGGCMRHGEGVYGASCVSTPHPCRITASAPPPLAVPKGWLRARVPSAAPPKACQRCSCKDIDAPLADKWDWRMRPFIETSNPCCCAEGEGGGGGGLRVQSFAVGPNTTMNPVVSDDSKRCSTYSFGTTAHSRRTHGCSSTDVDAATGQTVPLGW